MERELYRWGSPRERFRSISHSLGVVIASFVVGLLLAILMYSIVEPLGVPVENTSEIPVEIRVLETALTFVGFYLVCWWYLRFRQDDTTLFDIDVPTFRQIGWVVAGVLGLLTGLAALSVVLSLLGTTPAENAAITQGEEAPVYFLYLIPVALLLNGPAEELLFRGIVQGLFRQAYGVVPGIVAASTLFGAVHITAVLSSGGSTESILATLAVAAVLGLLLGALYEWTQNLVVPMLAHGIYNVFLFSLNYLRVTGQVPAIV